MEGSGEVPQEGLVRQRHPPPLLERQVCPRIYGGLPARRHRDHPRGVLRRAERPARRGLQGDFRPLALRHAPEPGGGRGPGGHLVEQLLRGGNPGRGRAVLRRNGRPQRPGAHFLRTQLEAGQGERQGVRAGLEGGRHVLAGHRADCQLARKGRGGGQRTPEVEHRRADILLPLGRPA